MRHLILSTLLAGTVLAVQPAHAASFFLGNSQTIDNKVKAFSDATHSDTGTSVYGITTDENALVKFTGDTTLKVTSGSGYAQISDAVDPEDWSFLTIALDSYAFGFNGIETAFKFLNDDVSQQDPGTLVITAYFLGGGSQSWNITDIKNSADISFYLLTDPGDNPFSYITLSSTPDRLSQLKQTDIGLQLAPIPESASWMMMLAGFGAIGYAMRRHRRTTISFA